MPSSQVLGLLGATLRNFRQPIFSLHLLLVLCIFIALLCGSKLSHSQPNSTTTDIILKSSNIIIRHGKHLYLVSNGIRHEISADRYTIDLMRQCKAHHDFLTINRDEFNLLSPGPHVPSLWDHHANTKLLSHGPSHFIESNEKFLKLLNPAIIYYRHTPSSPLYMIISWRITPSKIRVVMLTGFLIDGKVLPISGNIEQDTPHLRKIDVTHISVPFLELPGEDPRLFNLMPDNKNNKNDFGSNDLETKGSSIYVVFCRRYRRGQPELQMAYFKLIVEDFISGPFNAPFKLRYDDIVDMYFHVDGKRYDEKNWSPLQYNSKLLFIEAFSPMHRVVRPTLTNPKKTWVNDAILVGETLTSKGSSSSSSTPNHEVLSALQSLWPFGEIRGGTPAYLLPSSVKGSHEKSAKGAYLSFFHSSNDPYSPNCSGSLLKTYVMGAYTFEAEPPFRILKISKGPIVHPDMYAGPWTNLPVSYYHIDYVVFPTTLLFSHDKHHIHLIYGSQDDDSSLLKINLQKMLDSMASVTSVVSSRPQQAP